MTTNTHYANQNEDVWSDAAASCVFPWHERDDTHKVPVQHSWATHPVTLALLFCLDQLHIRNRRCKIKTLNKNTMCPPLPWAYCLLPSNTQLLPCFCFGISGSLLRLWSVRREWGTSKIENRKFGTFFFLSLFWQLSPLSSASSGTQILSYCLGSRQVHGS